MNIAKILSRHDFWPIIQRELKKAGFYNYYVNDAGQYWDLMIGGMRNGAPTTAKYPFHKKPSLIATGMFKTAFHNWVKDFPNNGFVPEPDHRVRSPGQVAKIAPSVVTKPTMMPKGQVPLDIMAFPAVGESDTSLVPYHDRVSTSKVLAVFLVDRADLDTLVSVAEGTAIYRGHKPALLSLVEKLIGKEETPVVEVEAPAPVLVEPEPVETISVAATSLSLQDQIILRMTENKNKTIWKIGDFTDLPYPATSVGTSLSILNAAGKVQRVARGQYERAM